VRDWRAASGVYNTAPEHQEVQKDITISDLMNFVIQSQSRHCHC
jgi:hypothetical protein